MAQYIYNSDSSSIPFLCFVFVCILYFAKSHSVCCKRRFEATFTSMSFLCVCRFSRGWALSLALCPDGFFLRACELVTISQVRRKFPRAEKVLFNTAPSFLTLTWPPCENRGRQFLTPRLKLVHRKPRAVCKVRRPVEWEPGLWLNTSNHWEIVKSKLHQQIGLMAIWKD